MDYTLTRYERKNPIPSLFLISLLFIGTAVLNGCAHQLNEGFSERQPFIQGWTVKGGNAENAVDDPSTDKRDLDFFVNTDRQSVLYWRFRVRKVQEKSGKSMVELIEECSDKEPVLNLGRRMIRRIECRELPVGDLFVTLDYQLEGWRNTRIERDRFLLRIRR